MVMYSYLGAIYHEVPENSMPPWAPDTNYLHFINERVLSENEKESFEIGAWVGPLGDTTELLHYQYFSNSFKWNT